MTIELLMDGRGYPIPVEYAIDDTGEAFPVGSCSKVYGYNGSDQLTTVTATWQGQSWVRTYGYTGTLLTSDSLWVRQ